MITVVIDPKEINRLYKKLHKVLNPVFDSKFQIHIGFHSGNFEATVKYSTELDFWLSTQDLGLNRYWNGYGVGKPNPKRMNSLTVEINFPLEGIDRRVAGAFGIESNGNILVLHRGKIGGGKPGIGKKLFFENFRGDIITASDGNKDTIFGMVGELNAAYFPRQVADFLFEIRRIKNLDKSESTTDFGNLISFQYTYEPFGQSVIDKHSRTTIDRTHGIVVNA